MENNPNLGVFIACVYWMLFFLVIWLIADKRMHEKSYPDDYQMGKVIREVAKWRKDGLANIKKKNNNKQDRFANFIPFFEWCRFISGLL